MTSPFSSRRIFVQIASYRDPECHATVTDLFAKAAYPGRISVGICWQYDPESDQECFAVDYPRPEQVRVIQYHTRDSQGAGWARNQAQSLWQGEEYTLQIQAHMRFEPRWDETLIELLERCPSPKSILTAWLPGYRPPDKKEALKGKLPLAAVSRLGKENDAQIVHLSKRLVPAGTLYGKLLPTCSWVGNFMFAHSFVLQDVPFDPHIYFWGEEINFSARLWTHGYDMYHLDRIVLYHYWDREGAKDSRMYRDHQDERNERSLARNRHLLGLEISKDAAALRDIDKYPLGKERSLADYWDFAGFNPKEGTLERKANHGTWFMEETRPQHSRIFVSIASYRDPECQHTLNDLFAKAKHPERIFVGICLQVEPVKEKDTLVHTDRPEQVRIKQVLYSKAEGANWARAEAHKLWRGEEYVLQIDSHMRFEPGWDDMLIDMLTRCPSQKPVLSAYLPNYNPPDKRDVKPDHLLRIRVRRMGNENDPQLLHVTGEVVPCSETERSGLYPSPFYIANFMFTRASTLQEVPIDPHFTFYGDEISYGARLWTHGYDIFQVDRIVLFHHWVRKETLHLQHYRNIKTSKSRRSLVRVKQLLGFEQASDRSALVDIDRYGLGPVRRLEDWWEFAGIDWQKMEVSEKALQGYWNMGILKKAKKAKAPAGKQSLAGPRIFVQIASYRDPDCQNTVKDLFDKAAHPERIHVGICWQFVKGEDDAFFKVPYPRPDQVRVQEVDAHKSKGVCWARSQVQKLWDGEEFVFQIDSHMRFEPGWDDMLLSMWKECESDKAVLTCYPPGFTPPDTFERQWIFGMSAKEFDRDGIFLMKGAPAFPLDKLPAKPIPGAFASANMLFGPASMLKNVPYDPHLYFFGEEISMAVRLWTHGYDLFHPNKLVIFHDWKRDKRKTHFDDHDWTPANKLSFARVKHMLGTESSSDPAVTAGLDKYGLGKARSLAEYQSYSGVDFAHKTISPQAMEGIYQPYRSTKPSNGSFAIGKSNGKDERIFVRIASYRDAECQWTVKDLFERARNPERINVGICWQFDEKEDQHCFEVSTRPDQVRMLPVDWREAEGVCWARNQTEMLWDGEDYTLQIDSHMRFFPGWDDMMIDELRACEADKPLISCSPASYTPPNNLQANPLPTVRRVQPFNAEGNIRGKGEYIDRPPEKPLNGAFIAAGFMFSRANVIEEVPYDPYLYFDQEEITHAARLYTHGWDVFSSRKPMIYHYYNTGDTGRPMHWRDLRKEDEKRIAFFRQRGLQRFNHISGHRESSDQEVLRELGRYGLGRARTFKQFEEYTGIDFKNKVATDRALRCQFIRDLPKYRARPIHVPEIDGELKPAAKPANGAAVSTPVAKPAAPVAAKPTVAVPAVTKPMERGDYVPLFEINDTNKKLRAMEVHGGKYSVLFFLPAHEHDAVKVFFANLHKKMEEGGKPDIWQMFILDESVDNLITLKDKYKTAHVLWADPEHRVARAFGIYKLGKSPPPTAYLLDPNLKIVKVYSAAEPAQLVDGIVADARSASEAYKQKFATPQVFTRVPPALIVPDAFTPEFCRKCIDAFRAGNTFQGTVGVKQSGGGYKPDAKVRTDFIVGGELLAEIDDKLSRSLFPEIKKVFGFEVTNRELYKIGMYSGEQKGFFRQHRDNFEAALGYRRVAMTLHLTDDYEGGGLHFPEYDRHIYRPALGSAIAFSCATLHEALPVTKGERFVLVGFFHGDEDEAYRRYYQLNRKEDLKLKDYNPTLRQYPELRQSRDFYKKWRDENVLFGEKLAAQPANARAPAEVKQQPVNVPSIGTHTPKKVFESKQAIIMDDFLPEDVYERVYNYALKTDYEYINTQGKVIRAWHIQDSFPLRSSVNVFYYAPNEQKQQGQLTYPSQTAFDPFIDHILATQPHVEHLTGKQGSGWGHVSVTSWIYPHGTGLAMHDDGSGVYSGAYVYFLNPTWRSHWGGLLVMPDEEANRKVHEYRNRTDQHDFYQKKWLHANNLDEMLMENGFAKCIFPKKNRMVFIANDAYHMVTRVNEAAGDNVRMSLAGFFNRKK